jgi:uncharacterized protein DUF4232
MIAPPKPSSHDDLEALIKEARARQLRRRLLGAAGITVAAAVGLSVYALFTGPADTSATAGRGGPRAAAACGSAGGWSLRLSSLWAEPTGQHTAPIVLKRLGPTPCTLMGYPRIALLDAHRHPLDFRYSHHGDLVVASGPPRAVQVAADGSAFFLFNKYRCDIRASSVARWLRVALPGVHGRLSLRLPRYPFLDYCPAEAPSRTIAVSPIVARPIEATAQPGS